MGSRIRSRRSDEAHFDTAVQRERAALAAYDAAADAEAAARAALEDLQCGTVIRREEGTLPGPGEDPAESDYWVDETPCALPAAHAGDHDPEPDRSASAPVAYSAALRTLSASVFQRDELLAAWQAAETALDALRCGYETEDSWGCVLRRGHGEDVPHEHPPVIRLMPEPLWIHRPDTEGVR